MQTVAIGTLRNEDIALGERLRRLQDMAFRAPHIARVRDCFYGTFVLDIQRTDGASEHVAGVGKAEFDIIINAESAVIIHGDEAAHTLLGMVVVVKGLYMRFMQAVHFLIIPLGIQLLNEGCVNK